MTVKTKKELKKYKVTGTGTYIMSKGYRWRVGTSKYLSIEECLDKTGFHFVLIFPDGSEDGFLHSEVTLEK